MLLVCFRAVWYDQISYPTSWQLDPTEGPNRERRRLQRCYLTIPNKYLLKDRRQPEGGITLFHRIWSRSSAVFVSTNLISMSMFRHSKATAVLPV